MIQTDKHVPTLSQTAGGAVVVFFVSWIVIASVTSFFIPTDSTGDEVFDKTREPTNTVIGIAVMVEALCITALYAVLSRKRKRSP